MRGFPLAVASCLRLSPLFVEVFGFSMASLSEAALHFDFESGGLLVCKQFWETWLDDDNTVNRGVVEGGGGRVWRGGRRKKGEENQK